jgi:cytochrome c oxidase cbb3-type subunit III
MPLVRFISTVCAIVGTLYCAACNRAGSLPENPPPVVRPQDVVDFWTLYSENCSACHGQDGQNGPALDLANPVYQGIVDDATLKKWITGGIQGSEMPAFGESAGGFLTARQVDALVEGLRKNWAKPDLPVTGAPPYAADLPGDGKSGEQIYRAVCAGCHQKPSERIINTTYLALVSNQGLRTITIAGRPDLGHPDWRQDRPDRPLTNEDVTNVVAYLVSLRSATPGQPYPRQP